MVLNVRSYADFKLIANSLRHLDAVLYKNSTVINGTTYGVAYAFDYQSDSCVALQLSGGISFSTSDFPSAVAIGDHLQVSSQTALADAF